MVIYCKTAVKMLNHCTHSHWRKKLLTHFCARFRP